MKTLYSLITKIPQLKSLEGVPMEAERVECLIELIEQYYDEIEGILQVENIPAMFVINIDEAGFVDWADAMKTTVVILCDFQEESVTIPMARSGKRASLLAAIAADGSVLTLAIVVPRKTVEAELME